MEDYWWDDDDNDVNYRVCFALEQANNDWLIRK